MKLKALLYLLIFSLLYSFTTHPIPLRAADFSQSILIEQLEDGYYYETFLEEATTSRGAVPNLPVQSTTKTKTTRMKDSSGNVLWTVSITATFTYDGTRATCTSCTPSAKSYASSWTIKSVTSSKNGNSAKATAVATQTDANGTSQNITKSVTITCSPTGVVS